METNETQDYDRIFTGVETKVDGNPKHAFVGPIVANHKILTATWMKRQNNLKIRTSMCGNKGT